MDALRVLFVGGSGTISSACSELAVSRGLDLYVLNRGQSKDRPLPAQATVLHGDIRDPQSVTKAIDGLDYKGITTTIKFQENGELEEASQVINLFEQKDGAIAVVGDIREQS